VKGTAVVIDLVKPGMKHAIRLTGRVASIVAPGSTMDAKAVPGMGIEFDAQPSDVTHRLRELLVSLAGSHEALEPDPVDPGDTWSPGPSEPLLLEPTAPPGVTPTVVTVPEEAKLMVQVRGLIMELGEWQEKVSALEKENAALKQELARLTAQLEGRGARR
jgi:hypothetical protein